MLREPIPCSVKSCKHYRGISQPDGTERTEVDVCSAFPSGIPEVITLGKNLHTEPYPGDNGIQYERGEPVSNAFCPTGPGGGVDPTCAPGGGGGVAPYSISQDRPWLNDTEKAEYTGLFKKQQALFKKIKAGVATDAEKSESEAAKARLNELSKVAKDRRDKEAGIDREKIAKDVKEKHGEKIKQEVKSEDGTDATLKGERKGYPPKLSAKDIIAQYGQKDSFGYGHIRVNDFSNFLDQNAVENDYDSRAHGMVKPQRMKAVEVDGVRFQWASSIPTSTVARAIGNAIGGSSIPEEEHGTIHPAIHKANEVVMFTDQRNMNDSHWEKAYGVPGFKAHATGGDGRIVVYNSNGMSRSVFAHEAGHNIATKEWRSTTPPEDSAYGKAQKVEKPVSEYGSKHAAEDFAEAVSLYADPLGRRRLKAAFPQKHDALVAILEKHK
jgi:hypothetical protein